MGTLGAGVWVLGSVAAPVLAWRTLSRCSDRPFAIAALVVGLIDLAWVVLAIVASSIF